MTDLLTLDQVAKSLQCSKRTVKRAMDQRGLRAVDITGNGTWRVRRADLEAWIEERANTPRALPTLSVTPLAVVAARPRSVRRTAGRLTLTSDMGRTA